MATIRLYKTYSFREKDPVIDELRTIIQDHVGRKGDNFNAVVRSVNKDSGVSVSCMRNWFGGTTRAPQSATVEAVGRALGKERVWVDTKIAERRARRKKK